MAGSAGGPVRPRTLAVRFSRADDELLIEHRQGGILAAGFLMLWLSGWTVGCAFLIGEVWRKPELFTLMFATPFWVSWLFVAALVVYTLFGRERIALDRQGLTVESQALVPLGSRTIPLDELITFREFQQERDDSVERGLEVVSLGLPQRPLSSLSLLELQWLRDQLQDHLAQLQAEMASGPYWEHLRAHIDGQPTPADLRTGWQTVPLHSDRREIPRRTDAHPTWPSDSPWRFDDDFDGVTFLRRGKRSFVTLWGLLFVNGFWNGIVGVFVLLLLGVGRGNQPEGMGWWGLFFFLLPFEAIGTGLFLGLLWEAIQPYCHTSWQITEGRVRCDWQAFGLYSRTWDSPLDQVARLEVRSSELSQTRPVWFRNGTVNNMQSSTSEPGYVLVWVSTSNADLAEIPKLSEGEARCVAEAVLQRFPEWNAP